MHWWWYTDADTLMLTADALMLMVNGVVGVVCVVVVVSVVGVVDQNQDQDQLADPSSPFCSSLLYWKIENPKNIWPLPIVYVSSSLELQISFLAVQTVFETALYLPLSLSTRTFYFLTFRVTLEHCDLWDIWSEWWGDMTWPTKRQLQRQRQIQRQWQWQRQIH